MDIFTKFFHGSLHHIFTQFFHKQILSTAPRRLRFPIDFRACDGGEKWEDHLKVSSLRVVSTARFLCLYSHRVLLRKYEFREIFRDPSKTNFPTLASPAAHSFGFAGDSVLLVSNGTHLWQADLLRNTTSLGWITGSLF